MRVLVTGSSGQIGTNLSLRLLADGHDVFGVDKRPNTWTDAFPYLLQDLSMQHAELDFPAADCVVHLAAHAKVHELVLHPKRALENAIITFNVLEYARQRSLPIVYASSREVYGDVHRFDEYVEASADFAFTESTYSASKIAGEAFVYSYARCYGLPYLVFRFSNVYGRYDNDLHRMVRVLPLFTHRLRRGEPITIYGGEEKTLDFTYVDDCVDGIARGVEALVAGRVVNETVNLAYGQGNTLVHAANLIAAELGVEPRATIAPSLLGEVTHYVAHLEKARTLLGYEPQAPLEDGIARMVAWFLERRATHPEEEHLPLADADSSQLGTKTYAA
ncbi:MAG TPA: NAD-dependent epimerase/dehydratase family protein [Gaiellaceae bacterium]|nr:NAD-dependent epimerase/dehydratase family protein [Gaiellaceae bacterium]